MKIIFFKVCPAAMPEEQKVGYARLSQTANEVALSLFSGRFVEYDNGDLIGCPYLIVKLIQYAVCLRYGRNAITKHTWCMRIGYKTNAHALCELKENSSQKDFPSQKMRQEWCCYLHKRNTSSSGHQARLVLTKNGLRIV